MKGGKIGKTELTGTVIGVDVTASEKVWKLFQAIGDIAFSYAFTTILIEIQACTTDSYYLPFTIVFICLLLLISPKRGKIRIP